MTMAVRRRPRSGERQVVRPGRGAVRKAAARGRPLARPDLAYLLRQLRSWPLRHQHALTGSWDRLARSPVASLVTAVVLGIALALPTGMHVMFKNVQQLSADWASAAQISLFLELSLSASDAEELAVRLRQRSDVRAVQLISREQALEEFRRYSGLREALDALAENPLPAVLSVVPAQATPQGSHALAQSLGQIEGVKQAQLDTEWVERLFQWLQLGQRVVMLLVFLLSVAVLLVVGNTIRLTIEGAREEIAVIKLVGGTDGFVRRPFLYTGFWFGLAGGVIAWLLVSLSLWWLQGPVARLSSLYRADFRLIGLDLADTGALLLFATVLGLSGAWLAVGRHLREVEFR